jgi:oligopeptide/dipeptide ABC transporter ATP-binding protein
MAISCNPLLLIADEPTTALDVIVQAEVLDLLHDLKERLNLSLILITHDLGVVANLADTIAVMYAGRVMEKGDKMSIFKSPRNPYTMGLLDSLPSIDKDQERLRSISGDVPDMINPPSGCCFHTRCPYATSICKQEVPPLEEDGKGHLVACFHHKEIPRR